MIEEGRHKQEELNTYLKKRIGKKYEKQKKWLKLISFLTEEKMLLTL